MVWCPKCVRDCLVDRDYATGYICCSECGRIHYQDVFTDEPTFVKGPGGESRLAGSFVKSIQNDYSESFKRTLENGRRQINDLMFKLNIPDESIGGQASSFYRIAVERSFTRGRITAHVAAACLYIACRANDKPYLLIDFTMWLNVNVYVLGAVYLQLCKLLSLEEHPFVQKPVDPSLFMHRFTNALMKGEYKSKVWRTALQIVASMKRDWMQTGRKPSGICGAALYISALSHGFSYPKSDIVKIVHICDATMTKRLIEFENTESGSLTIEEFKQKAEEFEQETHSFLFANTSPEETVTKEVLCQHKGKEPHFAHGLCRSCFKDFIELSGGLQGGSEPPAFQLAEMNRSAGAAEQMVKEPSSVLKPQEGKSIYESDHDPITKADSKMHPNNIGDRLDPSRSPSMHNLEKNSTDLPNVDETDSLSDIDDFEVNSYLNNKEECRYKKIIWEEMNKEYLQEQAAKEAAAAAAAAAALKDNGEASDDVRAARELAAAAAAAVAKSKEKRKQKRMEAKNVAPPQTAAEATRRMLNKKGLSSRINYDVLEKLFNETEELPDPKRSRVASDSKSDKEAAAQEVVEGETGADELSSSYNEQEQNDEFMEDEDAQGDDPDQYYDENGEEMFYHDDYQNDDDDYY